MATATAATDLYKNKTFARATVQAWVLSQVKSGVEVHDLEILIKFTRVAGEWVDEFVTELEDAGLIGSRQITVIEDGRTYFEEMFFAVA
jgi:hypothetical protein